MGDHWVKEAERKGDEIDAFSSWFECNKNDLLDSYIDSLSVEDIPEDFINTKYEQYCEGE